MRLPSADEMNARPFPLVDISGDYGGETLIGGL
jgi:hypothetical protein